MDAPLDLDGYLSECRAWVLDEIRAMVPRQGKAAETLYAPMLAYPLRAAKGLRPALCVATCRALGGSLEAVLPSAAVLELYHNAFLIHDDVEDGSEKRRDEPTLHRTHGVPVAVNVGDAMLALALGPLLDNMRVLDMGRAIRVLQVVARMARESAEGQAVELDWVRRARWELTDDDYLSMVDQKTGWYSFVAPVVIGAIVAEAPRAQVDALAEFARVLGAAFQIQDDALNLDADESAYGKEIAGDLWEGKHTLILLHGLRSMPEADRRRALAILAKPRPPSVEGEHLASRVMARARALRAEGELSERGLVDLTAALSGGATKTTDEVAWLHDQLRAHGSVEYARGVARTRAEAAGAQLDAMTFLRPSVHRAVLEAMVEFVVRRDR